MKQIVSILVRFVALLVLLGVFVLLSLVLSLPLTFLGEGVGFPIHWLLAVFLSAILFFVVSRLIPQETVTRKKPAKSVAQEEVF